MNLIYNNTVGILGRALACQLNPALKANKDDLAVAQKKLFEQPENSRLTINTTDGQILDGIKIGPANLNKAIILCLGSGGYYEELQTLPNGVLDQYVTSLRKAFSDYAIVIVNPRGVGVSTGYPSWDGEAKVDLDAIVSHTKDHLHMDKVVIWGHSLGGTMASQATNQTVVLDRTFTKISDVVNHKLGLTGLKATLATSSIWSIGWGIDLSKKIKNLSNPIIVYSPQDETIPSSVSLGKFLSTQSNKNTVIEMTLRDAASAHTEPLNIDELNLIKSRIEANHSIQE